MDYGTKVLMMRVARGLTQRQLANLAGTNEKLLGLIEHGTISPGYELREAIAEALGWPPEMLADIAFAILEGQIDDFDTLDYEMRKPA